MITAARRQCLHCPAPARSYYRPKSPAAPSSRAQHPQQLHAWRRVVEATHSSSTPHTQTPPVLERSFRCLWWPGAVSVLGAALLAVQVAAGLGAAAAASLASTAAPEDTFQNFPSQLSSTGAGADAPLSSYFKGEKRKSIEDCTRKCVPTCTRGGGGAPGLGPISMRREVVVFKEGFRSRQYCLSECAQVCSLSIQGPPPAAPAPAAAPAAGAAAEQAPAAADAGAQGGIP